MNRILSLAVLALVAAACSDKTTKTTAATARSKQALGTDVTISASNTSPAVSGSVSIQVSAPVHDDVSLIGQTLETSFDNTKLTVSAAPTVPQGWATTYFAGATQLGAAPTTPAGWASVTRMVASGSVQSQGAAAGQQVIVGNADGTVQMPPTATSFSGGSAGDGWDVFFSPDRTRVFNVHHHDGPATVMCRKAADGSSCGAGFPFALYHTSSRSTGWIDPDTLYFWHETYNGTTAGWECVDMSGPLGAVYSPPTYCPTRFVSAGFAAGDYDSHIELAVVGKELYSLDVINGRLTCLNAATGTACAGQPYAGYGVASQWNYYVSLVAIEGKIYVQGNNVVKCFDPATKAACTNGWPAAGKPTGQYRPVMAVPDANGQLNVCVQGDCWALNGGAHTLPSGFSAFMASNPVDSGCCSQYYSSTSYGGTKLYFPMSSSRVNCWDSATNAKCSTTPYVNPTTGASSQGSFPLSVNNVYSVRTDPVNPNCLWSNGDDGVIRTWDVPSGTAGCKAPPPPPPVVTYYPQAVIPRLACNDTQRIGSWRSFTVQNPEPSEYTSAKVTIKDSAGNAIAGWVDVALPANQVLDISGLTTAQTGLNPSFVITFTGMVSDIGGGTVTGGPKASFVVLGDAPQMCFTATMRACAQGTGLFNGGAATTAISATGSASLSGGNPINFNSASVTINDAASQVANCGATLNGTLATAAPAPVSGLVVALLDSAGHAVGGAGGAPLTATSAADGTYAFPALQPGSYAVRMTSTSSWTLKSITVTAGGSGTVTASAIGGNSPPVTLTGAQTSTVNGLYAVPGSDDAGVPAVVGGFQGNASFSFVASTLAPDAGASVQYSATIPLQDVRDVIGNSLEASIDTSRQHLTGAPTYPDGWNVQYFSGGQALASAPTTAAGWASVDRIVTNGNVRYDGVVNGYQLYVGATVATAPPPTASSFSGGSAGDGWDVFFSPDRTKVFNIHHHSSPATVMCRKSADGSSCGAGFPFSLYATGNRSMGVIDPATMHLWHPTFTGGQAGWECVDVSGLDETPYRAPTSCATRFVSAGFAASNYDQHVGVKQVGRKIFSQNLVSGSLTCLDLDANGGAGAPCAGQPYAGFGGTNINQTDLTEIGGKLYTLGAGSVKCFDPATNALCAGTQWPKSTSLDQPILGVPSADGVVRNVCVEQDCWSLDGSAHTMTAQFISYRTTNQSQALGCCVTYAGGSSGGTKVFWPTGANTVACWDTATNAACPNFPIPVTSIYAARVDPADENCLWTNGDNGVIRTWNISTGQSGCAPPPGLAKFKPAITLPRLACDPAKRVGDWSIFKLTAPTPAQYTSASLTIRDSRNTVIPGWQNIAISATQKIDLTGLTTDMTGSAPTFEVSFVGLNFTGNPTADFTVVSGSPELCFTAIDTCPQGPGLLPTATPPATDANATGSLTLIDNSVVPFAPITRTVQYQAPTLAACGGTIGGTFTSVESRPVVGVPVSLLDSSGNPIMSGGAAVTTTSSAQSTYAFPPLLAGSYQVKIADTGGWVIDSITVASGGSGTVTASSRQAISNTVSVAANTARTVNAQFHIGDSDGDGLPDNQETGPNFAALDTDSDGVPDHLDLDSDNDGVLDAVENRGQELPYDTDGDGIPDLRDSDSDGDGLFDAVESGASSDAQVQYLPGAVGANGVVDALETAIDSGQLAFTRTDTDRDGTPDMWDLDSDGDGMTDAQEIASDFDGDGIGSWRDLDSDNDGIPDAIEGLADTDSDGTRDSMDLDSDGDGISDAVEAGFDRSQLDANGMVRGPFGANGLADALETSADSGALNYAPRDQNGDQTFDFRSLDSDGDGLGDAIEKGVTSLPVDSDGDLQPDYLDLDSDGDGVSDAIETNGTGTLADTDSDQTPDYLDLDSDGDTIPDQAETSADFDGDGAGNWRDLDADGDVIGDRTETADDADQDAAPNYLDLDSDGDAISDRIETNAEGATVNTDGDLHPDYLDTDADGDGIPDAVETNADRDSDTRGNWRDVDSDDDGIPDEVERGVDGAHPRDTDGDLQADYLDLDSDDDGLGDDWEMGVIASTQRDHDQDGLPDYRDLDSDADGISDSLESNGNGTLADTDGDGSPDVLDDDTDADGISDLRETAADFDGDGIGNWRDTDSDADGLTDTFEKGSNVIPRDTDRDGSPDYLDVDCDGDGIADLIEKGPTPGTLIDTDGDGQPNLFDLDSDNDCRPDADENAWSTDPRTPNANASDNCGPTGACDTSTGACRVACVTDSDCGSATSGAICDLTTRLCATGCRGSGNHCPGTEICSSTTDAAGICEADSDGDGFTDREELARGLDPMSADSDHDGIPDAVEAKDGVMTDTDRDGTPDALDSDSDGDGIPDQVEGTADDDGDGIPNYRDLDSDGDGIPDSEETATDTDGDGIPDYRDTDSDNDGVPDAKEKEVGTSRTSRDTDGDGIPDGDELGSGSPPKDTDGDGIPDAIDTDSDNDGIPDAEEFQGGKDTDGDGIPDYLDTDGDGDGIPDSTERGSGATPVDSDGDGVPDTLDTDSDNDGVSDAAEGARDTDGDGIADYLDLDSDNDCVADGAEPTSSAVTSASTPQSDADLNCPASAPKCDTTVGRCILPASAIPELSAKLEGAGGNSGCSAVGGANAWLALIGLLGLAVRRRRS